MLQAVMGSTLKGILDYSCTWLTAKQVFSYETWTVLEFSLRHAESLRHAHSVSHTPNTVNRKVPHHIQVLSVMMSCVGEGGKSRKTKSHIPQGRGRETLFHTDPGYTDFSPPLPLHPGEELAVNKPVSESLREGGL